MAVSVSTEGLQEVAKELLTKKEEIMNVYNSKIKNIFAESKEAIVVSGLDYETVSQSINKKFQELDASLEQLSTTLTNDIIPNYNYLADSINTYFNGEFANEMLNILNG